MNTEGGPCPKCPSSDGFKVKLETGWGHCFVCNVNVPPEKIGEKVETLLKAVPSVPSKAPRPIIPIAEVFTALEDRSITKATAERYQVWRNADGVTHFPSFSGREHVGTKRKSAKDKKFQWTGEQGELFGQHLFPPKSAKTITLTEGEEDAMAAYELMGSKWPVVSVVNGTGTAMRDVKANYVYLSSFENIVICFDNDDVGQRTAKAIAAEFGPGKCRIMCPQRHKDANDYLRARDAGAFTKEWWAAPAFMPDGLKLGSTLWETVANRPNHFATAYPLEGLNRMTYGIRLSEMVVVTADTGVGKTSVLKEIEYKLLMDPEIIEKKYGVGFLHLEEPDYDTVLGLMSIHAEKPFHLPDTPRTIEELRSAFDAVVNNDRVVVWDHFGSNTVEAVLDKVRHMHALGCKYIVLDHLSIVVSDQSGDERKQLDEITTKLKTLCMELNIALIVVIHQNRQGSIRGTAGVEQMANVVMKLSREHKDVDPWRRNVTKIVIEKNRFCGRTGPACWAWYNETTNRMVELNEEEIQRYEDGGSLRDDERGF